MKSPALSVVTPSLNQGSYLPECLASVQDAAPAGTVEHLVIDGGSTDNTRHILDNQTKVRWISEPDSGQSQAINKGLGMAAGDIFGYLCADDLLEPGSLSRVLEVFQSDPRVHVVYGDGWFLEGRSGWKRRKNAGPFSPTRLRRGNFLIQPAVFWRRSVTERFGEFREDLHFCMDHEFWLRISAHTRWFYLQEPLGVSRLHADAKTSSQLAKAWEEAVKMQKEYGILIRPQWEALWMRTLGSRYYTFKRRLFEQVGLRRSSTRSE